MDPFDDVEKFNKRIMKMMEDMMRGLSGGSRIEIFTPMRGSPAGGGVEEARRPLVDTHEDEKTITVTAEVPGVEKGDISLKVHEDEGGRQGLVITAERKDRSGAKGRGGSVSSFSSLSYEEEVLLPAKVKKETAKAKYKNGILEVTFDKVKPGKTNKKGTDIPIE